MAADGDSSTNEWAMMRVMRRSLHNHGAPGSHLSARRIAMRQFVVAGPLCVGIQHDWERLTTNGKTHERP